MVSNFNIHRNHLSYRKLICTDSDSVDLAWKLKNLLLQTTLCKALYLKKKIKPEINYNIISNIKKI